MPTSFTERKARRKAHRHRECPDDPAWSEKRVCVRHVGATGKLRMVCMRELLGFLPL
jgi:hypothetical protein